MHWPADAPIRRWRENVATAYEWFGLRDDGIAELRIS